jgi:hypothetical protein
MDHKPPRQLHGTPPAHPQPDDDFKAASAATVDYDQYMPRLRPEHKVLRRIIKVVIVLVVAVGLGVAAFFLGPDIPHLFSHKAAPAVTKPIASKTVTTPTTQYMSTNQNLSFYYPKTWKVSETTDEITATSPAVALQTYANKTVSGRILMTVRDQNVPLSEFNAGSAVAVKSSQILTYTNPAADQQASAYISFLNYANSKGTGIDGVYVTGNTGYQTGQEAPASNLAPVEPIIALTFEKCSNNTCAGTTTPLAIATSSWSNKAFTQPLETMLKSFVI